MAWSDPATGKQLHQIALYSSRAGIEEPIRDKKLTRGEAREILHHLRLDERANKGRRQNDKIRRGRFIQNKGM